MTRTKKIIDLLSQMFPNARCELNYSNNFELLAAVMLSAQTTDKSVNKVTPELFSRYPSANSLKDALFSDVKEIIKTIGLSQTKAKNLIQLSQLLEDKFHGIVPKTMEELQQLPGVGRKTANVVMSLGFNIPSIAVDTHVKRVSIRLRIASSEANELKIEEILMAELPKDKWIIAHHALLFFGRYHCFAKNPLCDNCPLVNYCITSK